MDAVTTARLQGLLERPLDWEYILTVGRWHGVLPLVHRHLLEAPPSLVPQVVGERLRLGFEQTQRRNLYLSLHLGAILKRFAAEGIAAIPYKGPTLAVMAYGRLGLREFLDLDILVKKDDVLRAKDVLVAEGYRPVSRLRKAEERALVESQHAYVLDRPDGIVVELHWEISPRYVSRSPEPERFWERLSPVVLTGTTVHTLPPEVLLPSLCEHGAKHIWGRLAWICDIGELVQARPDLDWPRIVSEARRTGSERMLALGLRLANDLLGAPMPEAVRRYAETDAAILLLVSEVRMALFRNRSGLPGLLEQARFHLRVHEQWRQRLRYCWLALTTVTVEDLEQRPLPRALSFLHYPMRLIRLAGGAFRHRHH
ncbi:MAG TPA: nucleotidyltransferase family protein [Candidatus Acidoferrum sp.]|nr:nucleotidyltransferase family protein [Candidatus Acidoferrum sp.]